jgi:hypothetical protein
MPIINNSTAAQAIIIKNRDKLRKTFGHDKMTDPAGKVKIEKLVDDVLDVMLDLIKNITVDINTGIIS